MCLFYTENMFSLQQMRKNLRTKIRGLVEKLGPEIFEDFDSNHIVKRKQSTTSRDSFDNKSRASGSFISSAPIGQQFSYYQ
jgi:hypothetical protein